MFSVEELIDPSWSDEEKAQFRKDCAEDDRVRRERKEWFQEHIKGEIGDFVRDCLTRPMPYEEWAPELERRYFAYIPHKDDYIHFADSFKEAYQKANRYGFEYSGMERKYYKRLGEQASNIYGEEELDLIYNEHQERVILGFIGAVIRASKAESQKEGER